MPVNASSSNSTSKKSRPSVFIVEDETLLSESLKSKLEDDGYQVLVCDEFNRAIKMAGNQKFCCIVVDQALKGGEGERLISTIRKSDKHLNFETPILLMSANVDRELLLRLGKKINGALVKPFDRADLSMKVKQLCPVNA